MRSPVQLCSSHAPLRSSWLNSASTMVMAAARPSIAPGPRSGQAASQAGSGTLADGVVHDDLQRHWRQQRQWHRQQVDDDDGDDQPAEPAQLLRPAGAARWPL